MAALTVDDTALRKLSASFEGDLVMVGDPTYEEHRKVWNGSIDRFPALIARCRGVADVMAAVMFARSAGLPVAVRTERSRTPFPRRRVSGWTSRHGSGAISH